jgi:N-methylhydantoinase A/oxoprolinase/acetone carboxylase beta subunit
MIRLGIDVGGTHTDAVVIDGVEVVAKHKALTSADVTTGIVTAAESVLADCGVPRSKVDAIMIGTTQFTNAVVQRRGLAAVFALRVGAQSTSALPPFHGWPEDLQRAVMGRVAMIDGGHEFDGTPVVPLDEPALRAALDSMQQAELDSLAVCSLFSFVTPATESGIRDLLRERSFVRHVSLSNELGGVGLHLRENATLLNAALRAMAEQVMSGYRAAMEKLGLSARLFVSQNDGTLMDAGFAAQYPVLTISSGPTNSMRGAAHLTGLRDAIVVDVGGTTSDVGMLTNGFPRRSGGEVTIGGVATNFRMPDVLSIGLGGGSLVQEDGGSVGPVSVGNELRRRARCFGGEVLTATDVACARDLVDLGPRSHPVELGSAVTERALAAMGSMFTGAVQRMKVTPGELPLVAVGGAAFLIPDEIEGISHIVRPQFAEVANAVGAAMGKVGAESEIVYSRGKESRIITLDRARKLATDKAIAAGADRQTVEIMEIEEVPISYLDEPLVRLRVKAAGEIKL